MTAARQLALGGTGDSRGAVLSEDGLYRYRLWRRWGDGQHVLWVMLNPSTADADVDDPTIRKCIGFTKRWGLDGIEVVNCFALRATNPAALRDHPDPVGPDNLRHVREAAAAAGPIILAWGANRIPGHDTFALGDALMVGDPGRVSCLARNNDGTPKHPLYVSYSARPVPLVRPLP